MAKCTKSFPNLEDQFGEEKKYIHGKLVLIIVLFFNTFRNSLSSSTPKYGNSGGDSTEQMSSDTNSTVVEKSDSQKSPKANGAGHSGNVASKEVKGKTHTYYQVLIDNRDCPYITTRAQTESVTFLGNHSENTRNLYAIPGLDYVAHEDILPYATRDENPIQHELFDKFLAARNITDLSGAGDSGDVAASDDNEAGDNGKVKMEETVLEDGSDIKEKVESQFQGESRTRKPCFFPFLKKNVSLFSSRHTEGLAGEEPPLARVV